MYCATGAPNNVSYKNDTHMPPVSIHYFTKDVAVWLYERVSIVDIEEIFYSSMSSASCSAPA